MSETTIKISDGEVQAVARAFCKAFGHDPDEIVPWSGYEDSPSFPRWQKEAEWALRCIVAIRVLGQIPISSNPEEAAE